MLESATPTVSIAVPIYNGAARLPALFAHLDRLEGSPGLSWEIIAIDNNSTDGTGDWLRSREELHGRLEPDRPSLVYAVEPRQGAAWARLRAMAIARGDWVFFLDDDNWPEPDWLRRAWEFVQDRPRLAAVGGKVCGNYGSHHGGHHGGVTLPPQFDRVEGFWAVRTYERFGDRAARFNPALLQLPPAAALMVRRRAWLDCVPDRPGLTGKVPGRLVQGDDYEPLLYLARSGWEIWFCPALVTHHQIGAGRLTLPYALDLGRGCGLATYYLRSLLTPRRDRAILALRTVLGSLRKAVPKAITIARRSRLGLGRDRKEATWVDRVELAFLWGCMLSPFYARRHLPPAPDCDRAAAEGAGSP